MGIADKGIEFLRKLDTFGDVKRRWIIKVESETDFNYGKLPYERNVDELLNYGIINLDKPPGPTSHEVVAWAKKLLNIEKAGHGGTLVPVHF